MPFEWDEEKNQINIHKHGIDFQDAVDIFNHPMLSQPDHRANYGEDRWVAIGLIYACPGVIVFTERTGDRVRIISARKATKRETRLYEEKLSD